jgi:hypothetical protein
MTVRGETTNIAANVAIVAVKLREGKTKQQILAETGWCRQTLAKYIKAHLADELKAVTQGELQLHLRIELERCDDLEDRIEAGTMTDAKRIQLLLSVVKHRCELLGLFPKEPLVQINTEPKYQRPNINIIITDDAGEKRSVPFDDFRKMPLKEHRKQLNAAPITDAEIDNAALNFKVVKRRERESPLLSAPVADAEVVEP